MADNTRAIETATLLWEGRTIEVRYEPDWLGNNGIAHLDITCIDPPRGPLPITETGYRSAFLHADHGDEVPDGDFIGYVRFWLDDAANGKEWQTYVQASRQLSLF